MAHKSLWTRAFHFRVKTEDHGVRWFTFAYGRDYYVGVDYIFGTSNYVTKYRLDPPTYADEIPL